jgi:hypothetical protein
MRKDEPLSPQAQRFADKMFECEKPCDSYGVCDPCIQRALFIAGYNFGYRAGKAASEKDSSRG